MPTRTNYTNISRPFFAQDYDSLVLGKGYQIDWAAVLVAYQNDNGKKVIPAGTVMAKVAGSQKLVPRVDRDIVAQPTETAVGILVSYAEEDAKQDALSGYGLVLGGSVYETLLPDVGDVEWATIKTELNDAGTGFHFETYSDTRVV